MFSLFQIIQSFGVQIMEERGIGMYLQQRGDSLRWLHISRSQPGIEDPGKINPGGSWGECLKVKECCQSFMKESIKQKLKERKIYEMKKPWKTKGVQLNS